MIKGPVTSLRDAFKSLDRQAVNIRSLADQVGRLGIPDYYLDLELLK